MEMFRRPLAVTPASSSLGLHAAQELLSVLPLMKSTAATGLPILAGTPGFSLLHWRHEDVPVQRRPAPWCASAWNTTSYFQSFPGLSCRQEKRLKTLYSSSHARRKRLQGNAVVHSFETGSPLPCSAQHCTCASRLLPVPLQEELRQFSHPLEEVRSECLGVRATSCIDWPFTTAQRKRNSLIAISEISEVQFILREVRIFFLCFSL